MILSISCLLLLSLSFSEVHSYESLYLRDSPKIGELLKFRGKKESTDHLFRGRRSGYDAENTDLEIDDVDDEDTYSR